jgi:hypothetical protein
MTDVKSILSVIGTVKSRLPDLAIKNGQLIFVQDSPTIALDFNGKRTFYNEIITISTEEQRQNMLAPISGSYYFVVESAVLWTYQTQWIQITTKPQDIIFIGTNLPELGKKQTLYADKTNHNISVWDDNTLSYEIIADKTQRISEDEIASLFS